MCDEPRREWQECCRETSGDGSVVLDASSNQLYTNLRLVGLTRVTNDEAIMAGTTRNSNRCEFPKPHQPARLTDATATFSPCLRCGVPQPGTQGANGTSVPGAWNRSPRHRSAELASGACSSLTSASQTRIAGAVGTSGFELCQPPWLVSRTRPPSAAHRNVPMDLRCSRG